MKWLLLIIIIGIAIYVFAAINMRLAARKLFGCSGNSCTRSGESGSSPEQKDQE